MIAESFMLRSTLSFSRRLSKGSFKSSVQFAKKTFRTERDFTPRIFIPMRLRKNMKQKTAKTLTISDDANKSRVEEAETWPLIPLMKTIGIAYNAGCKIE